MLVTCRLASYTPKGKEKQAMKQQKAMLVALIVICLTVIVTALMHSNLTGYSTPHALKNRPNG